MASFDDLFGGGNGGSGRRFMKFENEGEAFLLVQTGEPKLVPQKNQNGEIVYLVQVNEGDKYKPMGKGTFDEDTVANAFMPEKEIVIPARAVGKKLKDGSKDPDFEEFDTDWELTKDQKEKFKEAMLDAGVPAEEGTKYVVKLLSRKDKPYKYSVKILTD